MLALLLLISQPDAAAATISDRLAAHRNWDTCVVSAAERFAALPDPISSLAEAALGACAEHQDTVTVRQNAVVNALDRSRGGDYIRREVEAAVERWRTELRERALAIVAERRLTEQR